MNGRERILNTVRGLPVDHPAAAPYMGNFAISASEMSLSQCYTRPEKMVEAQLKAWKMFGQDVIVVQSDNYYMAEAFGVSVVHNENEMPVVVEPLCKTPEDILRLKGVDPLHDGRMPVYIEAIRRIRTEIGEAAAIRGCGTGPFVLAGHLCGIEQLLMWMAETEAGLEDYSELLDKLLSLGLEALIGFTTAQLEAGATIIQLADSLASLNVISPDMYRKSVFPYEKKFFAHMKPLCRKYDAAALLHICGNNTLVLEDYVQTGADIIAIDHAVDLAEASGIVNGRATIIGNLDPSDVMIFGNPQDVREQSVKSLNTVLPHPYILGTGCEVSVQTPHENIQAMLRAAREYGGVKE